MIDPRTRKLMRMHKALHPRDDVYKLYVSRKGGGRGLASNEDRGGKLITATGNNTGNTETNRTKIGRKQK